jgi:hypothetical protein
MTRRHARWGVLVLIMLASALALVSSASAAIALVFDRARAVPGERITARQPGRLWGGSSSDINVYLVPIAIAAKVSTNPDGSMPRRGGLPNDRRIVPIGKLITRRGIARVVFRVPNVRRGRYTTAVWCKPCAPPNGTFFASRLSDTHDRGVITITRR